MQNLDNFQNEDSLPSNSSLSTSQNSSSLRSSSSVRSATLSSHSQTSIDDILVLPKTKVSKSTRAGLTSTAQCVSESPFLQRLRQRKLEKQAKCSKLKPKSRSKAKPKKMPPKRCVKRRQAATARILARDQNADTSSSEDENEEYFCGVCHIKYGADDEVWIQCNNCATWYHTTCVEVDIDNIPDVFLCFECDD